jgi:hypothetical protein
MKDGAYKLKEAASLGDGLNFKAGQDFEVVNSVVYMDGYPLPPHMQKMFYTWILNNMKLFMIDSRKY